MLRSCSREWEFVVTNLETPSRAVVRFYNKRGTVEQWIKEGKQAVKMSRLSCRRFRSNQVRLGLSLLAYNLGNLWRRPALPKRIENWSLTSLQQQLVKTGGRLVKHARYYWLLLAEGHLSRERFRAMLGTGSRCYRYGRGRETVVRSAAGAAIQSGQRKSVAEAVPTNAQFQQSWG